MLHIIHEQNTAVATSTWGNLHVDMYWCVIFPVEPTSQIYRQRTIQKSILHDIKTYSVLFRSLILLVRPLCLLYTPFTAKNPSTSSKRKTSEPNQNPIPSAGIGVSFGYRWHGLPWHMYFFLVMNCVVRCLSWPTIIIDSLSVLGSWPESLFHSEWAILERWKDGWMDGKMDGWGGWGWGAIAPSRCDGRMRKKNDRRRSRPDTIFDVHQRWHEYVHGSHPWPYNKLVHSFRHRRYIIIVEVRFPLLFGWNGMAATTCLRSRRIQSREPVCARRRLHHIPALTCTMDKHQIPWFSTELSWYWELCVIESRPEERCSDGVADQLKRGVCGLSNPVLHGMFLGGRHW